MINSTLESIIRKKSKEYGMEILNRQEGCENVVSIFSKLEDYHLFYTIHSGLDVPELNIQYSFVLEQNQFRVQAFVEPIMIQTDTQKEEICILLNEMNARMRVIGEYVLDTETGDVLYDLTVPYSLVETMPEYIGKTIFDDVIRFWKDIHIPLVMYTNGLWDIYKSVDYLTTLIDEGMIDNSLFGL
jgi:hypothetical protein